MASGKGPQTRSQFHAFLREVGEATDKQAVVDRFVAAQHQFPITEESGWVHFVYQGEGTDLAVAGDMFGARQEHAMERIAGTNFFYHSMQLDLDARLNYVFMRDFNEIVDPRNDRQTVSRMLTKDMEMSFSGEPFKMSWFAMPKWKAPAFLTKAESPTMGRVERHELDSKTLGAKFAFDVYVPHGYDDSDTRYPVAYVHGGQAAKEHGHITEAFDHLCGSTIKPTMLVFISHRHPGPAEEYADMLVKELIPMIDETYRTEKSADGRASVGFGFAGVTAFQCAVRHPDVIGKFASQSPFIFDSAKASINKLMEDYSGSPLTVYVDWGKYDFRNPHEAWDIGETAEEFADTLKKKGFNMHGGEVNDGTGWSSWPNRFDVMFGSLFPKESKG